MQFAQESSEFPVFLLVLDNGQKVVICYIMAYIVLSFNAYIVFSFIAIFAQTKMSSRSRSPFPGSSQRRRAAASGADNDDQCPTTRFSNDLDECEICAH
jgi:hypothetical protein